MRRFLNKYIILIIVLAAFLRLWKLDVVPPHLTQDEAALGYNAFSILKTARDEHGEFLPVVFKSFGDYKPGLYVYLTVPFVALLGLNEWSVRLSSALAGVLAVWVLHLIFMKLKREKSLPEDLHLEIIAPLLLTINPWHIQFSRGAWEANVSLTLTLIGILFFLKSFNNARNVLLSVLAFSLTLIAYQGAKLSTLIVVASLAFVYKNQCLTIIRNSKLIIAASIIVGLLIVSPIIYGANNGQLGRLKVFSVLSYPRQKQYLQDFLNQGNERIGSVSYYLYHTEINNFSRGIIGRWFNAFSGKYLFFDGDYQNPRHSPPHQGMMLLVDIILLPVGMVALIRRKGRFNKLILLWLILAPLPAVLSRDQVQAVRSLNMSIPLVIVSSFGLGTILKYIRNIKQKMVIIPSFLVLALLIFTSLVFYFDSYYIHLPKDQSEDWGYGYKQAFEFLKNRGLGNRDIYVGQSYSQPYIFYLFFNQYDPSNYQKQSKIVEGDNKYDVGFIEKIDSVHFIEIKWQELQNNIGAIIVATDAEFPHVDLVNNKRVKILEEIRYLDSKPAYRIIEVL